MENLGKMKKRDDGDEMSSIAETDPAIGFKFVPTEEQLIKFFLFRKAMGLPLPGFNPIVEKDLYGDKHPSDVFSDILDSPYWNTTKDLKREMYVFTRLSKVNEGKTRFARTCTGHGTWEGQTGVTTIVSESTREVIGKRKMLSFEERKLGGSKRVRSSDRWIMHEFSLDGVLKDNYDLKYEDYVICKIIRKVPKRRSEEEDGRSSTLHCKKQKTTLTFDHDHQVIPADHIPYNSSEDMLMLSSYNSTAPTDQEYYYSHDHEPDHLIKDHTSPIGDTQLEFILKDMIDKELEEGTGNVQDVTLSSEECHHINQLYDHISTTKDVFVDQLRINSLLDDHHNNYYYDLLEGTSGNEGKSAAVILPADQVQSNIEDDKDFDWANAIDECLSRIPDDNNDGYHDEHGQLLPPYDQFHLEVDGPNNGRSISSNNLSLPRRF